MDRDPAGIELRHLRHALAVAEAGHFGRAAAALGMAQPPLSRSVMRLERAVGARLFERGRRGARPTPAGEAFLAEARVALAAADRAAGLARAAAERAAPVRVGFASAALWGPLPGLLAAARAAPIPVELHEMPTAPQVEALAAGRLDLGFVAPPVAGAPTRMAVRDLGGEALVAALPAGRATPGGEDATRAAAVPLAALAGDLVLFPAAQGPALHAAILEAFRAAGLVPRVAQEAARMPTILTLVGAGLGCALVPEGVPRHWPVPGVAFRRVVEAPALPRWPLALAHMPLAATGPAARLLAAWRREGGREASAALPGVP